MKKQPDMEKTVAVILAAGSGSRTGLAVPKQFLMLDGKTVLEHSVQTFHDHAGIDELVIVTSALYFDRVRQIAADNGWSKPLQILEGGRERYDSSLAAVRAYAGQPDTVMLFHDAARPLVSADIISDCLEAMKTCNCVDVAIPAADTVVQCDSEGMHMQSVPDRSLMWQMQTPQCFRQQPSRRHTALPWPTPGSRPPMTAVPYCAIFPMKRWELYAAAAAT